MRHRIAVLTILVTALAGAQEYDLLLKGGHVLDPKNRVNAPRDVAIAQRLRAPLGALQSSFPAPGGGMDLARVRRWRTLYGPETLFLLGSGLLQEPDIEQAVADLLRAVGAE